MTRPALLAVGGAHIDRRGHVIGDYIPAASNPVAMREEVGGGAFNALRGAVLRGVDGTLLSVRGGDSAGDAVAASISRAGIRDISATYLDRTTPSYTAVLDDNGDLIAGFADMQLYDIAFPKQVSRRNFRDPLASANALLCDANLPEVALSKLFGLVGSKPVYAIAISPAKATRLKPHLANLDGLFMNLREARRLAGCGDSGSVDAAIAGLCKAGLNCGVITDGGGPITAYLGGQTYSLTPPSTSSIVDVTGAGDALAGAIIAALLKGENFAAALRHGVAAAHLAIRDESASPSFDDVAFDTALEAVAEPVAILANGKAMEHSR